MLGVAMIIKSDQEPLEENESLSIVSDRIQGDEQK
jgi:hypothetical protein